MYWGDSKAKLKDDKEDTTAPDGTTIRRQASGDGARNRKHAKTH